MQALLEQLLSEARSAWRFRWYAVAAAWAIGVVGLGAVVWLPNIYGASARVYVDGSSVLRPLLTTQIVEPDVSTSLMYVRQALVGRDYLLRVISENGLNEDAVSATDREKVLEKLRRDIVIDAVPADPSSRTNASSIFTIKYRHKRPQVAEGVVRSFMNFLIEDTHEANQEGTDIAAKFLDDRIAEHETRLDKAEQALAEFQRLNSDTLPGTEGGYFQRLQAEKDALEKTRRDLRLAQSRRDRLRQQLTSEAPLVSSDPNVNRQPRPDSIDERIRVARADLDKMLLQYTEKHPAVIAQKESLQRLEQQRADQLRALGITNPDQQVSALDSNPVYQSLQIAVNDVEVDIATLEADVRDRERKLADLQGLIEKVPGVEAELARLNRDYNIIKTQYQGLIQSRETQHLSQQASSTDQVDFYVLNPPRTEVKPVAPPRLMLLAGVLMAALGTGAGVSWLLAQLRPVFSNARALRELTGLPVLGSVSRVFVDPQVVAKRRFALVTFSIAIVGLIVLAGGLAVFELVGPGVHSLVGGT